MGSLSPDDRLPHWPDSGCNLHPKCLECPEPICQFDLPADQRPDSLTSRLQRRNAEILQLRESGVKRRVLLARYGISKRQFYRIAEAQ